MSEARERTLELVAPLSVEQLERVHSKLMSPLVWDLAHIAAFEDLWLVHRYGEEPMVRPDLAQTYDAFETPRARRGDLKLLGYDDSLDYLSSVRKQVLEIVEARGLGDGFLHELVLRHELQHTETMLQTMQLAQLEFEPGDRRRAASVDEQCSGLDLIEVPAGEFEMGAAAEGFAYDNERPRHRVDLAEYRIGRTPVTSGDFLDFIERGGYADSRHWSSAGWRWRERDGAERPRHWTADGREWRLGEGFAPIDPRRPVIHVSWYEAEAFANFHGLRLPTEPEWERAASSIAAIGDVWEWTSTDFGGYPGFRAYPYREYSEVFFGTEYKVLRGSSWATSPKIATTTFRNWDLPQRRQIFAGFRVAG